jgi:putative nucleotidyltransferase with HDIG domain
VYTAEKTGGVQDTPIQRNMMEQMFLVESEQQTHNTEVAVKRVVFVDDEQSVLDGLKRTLQSMPAEWHLTFCTSGQDALRLLASSEVDVIVTDMRMPGMSGSELLAEVLERYPSIVRIVLSGNLEHDLALRSATTAHQYLVKPCDAATLRATLDAALRIRSLLVSPKLRRLVSRMTSLPSLPSVYAKLVESLENAETSSRELGEIIAQDVGMTAKILQLANSAFFGLYRYIANPCEAAVYLGVDTIRSLALSTSVFSAFQGKGVPESFIAQLQRHSMTTGVVAHAIARAQSLPKKACDSSLVGGFLHDVGKLVLVANYADEYYGVLATARREKVPCHEVESRVFAANHAEIGAYLLWLWGLPDSVCNAVAFHHKPADCSSTVFTAAGTVHVADALQHEMDGGLDSVFRADIDMNYLAALRLTERLPEWRNLCSKHSETE